MDKEGKGLIEAALEACRMRLASYPDDVTGVYSRVLPLGDQYLCPVPVPQNACMVPVLSVGMVTATILAIFLLRSCVLCGGTPPLWQEKRRISERSSGLSTTRLTRRETHPRPRKRPFFMPAIQPSSISRSPSLFLSRTVAILACASHNIVIV